MPKELFPGSADFKVTIFKIPQISKNFSALLVNCQLNTVVPQIKHEGSLKLENTISQFLAQNIKSYGFKGSR